MSERGSYRSTREFEGFVLFLSCGNKRAMHAYLCRSSCFFVRAGPGAPDARLVVLRRLSININIVNNNNNNNNNNKIKRQGRHRTCHYFLGCVRPLITLRTHASPPKPLQHLRITSIFITYPPPPARACCCFSPWWQTPRSPPCRSPPSGWRSVPPTTYPTTSSRRARRLRGRSRTASSPPRSCRATAAHGLG